MARLFPVGSLFLDVAGSVMSLVAEQFGLPDSIGINVLSIVLPLVLRVVKPLWVAIADAPEVLSFDVRTFERSRF